MVRSRGSLISKVRYFFCHARDPLLIDFSVEFWTLKGGEEGGMSRRERSENEYEYSSYVTCYISCEALNVESAAIDIFKYLAYLRELNYVRCPAHLLGL